MTDSEPSEAAQQFLIQLFEQTKSDGSIQVSMYDIGELLGMDRDTASTVAQELMADLKTTEAQLASSRPKTAIIRECLRSVLGVVENAKDSRIPGRIRKLMEG
jgi:hypothetical protein